MRWFIKNDDGYFIKEKKVVKFLWIIIRIDWSIFGETPVLFTDREKRNMEKDYPNFKYIKEWR